MGIAPFVIFGLTITSTVLISSLCAIVVIAGIIYCVSKKSAIRYQRQGTYIEISNISTTQASDIVNKRLVSTKISWKRIQLTKADQNSLSVLTDKEFNEKVSLYQCSISHCVMQSPAGMKCCNGKQFGDLDNIKTALSRNPKKCPMCGSSATINDIIEDSKPIKMIKSGINDLRKQMLLTFNGLSPQIKAVWKEYIELNFGQGYCKEHLNYDN